MPMKWKLQNINKTCYRNSNDFWVIKFRSAVWFFMLWLTCLSVSQFLILHFFKYHQFLNSHQVLPQLQMRKKQPCISNLLFYHILVSLFCDLLHLLLVADMSGVGCLLFMISTLPPFLLVVSINLPFFQPLLSHRQWHSNAKLSSSL